MQDIILINITGEDRPGLTAAITKVLAEGGAQILDIGQAVIHQTLSFGILIKLPNNTNADVLKEVLFCSYKLNQHVRFTPITETDYQSWVEDQGKTRHIITLLARKITAEQLCRISSITAAHHLNIDHIDRLSGRISLQTPRSCNKACIEFSVRGDPSDLTVLKEEFLQVGAELGIDIAFQKDTIYRRSRRLAVFDMDSTLIDTEVIDELAKAAGVGEQVSHITEQAMRGEIDFKQSFKARLSLLKGLSSEVLEQIAEKLPLTEGATTLFKELKRLGYRTAILSGGFTYFAKKLQQQLGIDYIYANELEIKEGKLTGNAIEPIIDATRKADLLKMLAEKENISLEQTIAVGDGANDLPMLATAGLGVAFRAKPLVKKSAEQAISTLGLDAILYLLGYRDREIL